jgi:hypothetical protein
LLDRPADVRETREVMDLQNGDGCGLSYHELLLTVRGFDRSNPNGPAVPVPAVSTLGLPPAEPWMVQTTRNIGQAS